MNINTKKGIYVAVLNQGTIDADLAVCLLNISHQDNYNVMITFPGDRPISHNRNKIVQDFLRHKNMDYLLMIDDDNVPPINILNLADFDKDVICGMSFGFQQGMIIPSIFKRKDDGLYTVAPFKGDEGLMEVDAAGSGQMMISRRVLEKIRYPFRNEYDADGIKRLGLDLNFCQRVKELGFKVYAHLDYISSHVVPFDLKKHYMVAVERDEYSKRLDAIKIHADEVKNKKKNN
jgi:hypothetical protein